MLHFFSSTANPVGVMSQAVDSGTVSTDGVILKPLTRFALVGIWVLCLLLPLTATAHPGHSHPSAELAAELASAEPGRLLVDEARLKAWPGGGSGPGLPSPTPLTQIRLHVRSHSQ